MNLKPRLLMLKIVLYLFLFICVFDPADKVLGIKVHTFIIMWILFGIYVLVNKIYLRLPKKMILFFCLFYIVPLISIVLYYFVGDNYIKFDGLQYFKTYMFVSIVIIVFVTEIKLIEPAVIFISSISIITILISILYLIYPEYIQGFSIFFGKKYGVFEMGNKLHATFMPDLPTIYFHTAELIILPVGYFSVMSLRTNGRKRVFNIIMLLINMYGLYASDTRNNILASILIPMTVIFWYSKRKIIIAFLFSIFTMFIFILNLETFKEYFDLENPSTSYKIGFARDYIDLFSDESVILFGQGLGSYFYTTNRGYVSITELSYFEFLRRFGILLGTLSIVLFLVPLIKLFSMKHFEYHYVYIVHLFLMIITFFNPLLLTSSGMLIFSIILVQSFRQILVFRKWSFQAVID